MINSATCRSSPSTGICFDATLSISFMRCLSNAGCSVKRTTNPFIWRFPRPKGIFTGVPMDISSSNRLGTIYWYVLSRDSTLMSTIISANITSQPSPQLHPYASPGNLLSKSNPPVSHIALQFSQPPHCFDKTLRKYPNAPVPVCRYKKLLLPL